MINAILLKRITKILLQSKIRPLSESDLWSFKKSVHSLIYVSGLQSF